MICKGCGKNKKLIRAHVIPKSFFTGLQVEGKSAIVVADNCDYPKRSRVGIYDPLILCHECEQIFQNIDNYGQDLLLKRKLEKIEENGIVRGYKISGVDYSLIKLFFISILWRASISAQDFYHDVNLGRFENIAKDYVWSNNPGTPEEFSFILEKFTDNTFGTAMFNPYRIRIDEINYYTFYLYGYKLFIKVDKRPAPSICQRLLLKPGEDITVVGRDIFRSKELKAMYDLVKKNK